MSMTYKQDLRDIAVAVAQQAKAYTDKKIEDFRWELGTYDLGVDTINGTTMLLPSPSGAIKATMVEIDGASEVSENLIVLQDVAQTTTNGITYKVENGAVTLDGTATSTVSLYLAFTSDISIGTYSYNQFAKNAGHNVYLASAQLTSNTTLLITQNSTTPTATNITTEYVMKYLFIYIGNGNTITNYSFTPMLVKGSTAPTEFKVGYTGIHNLELSGLKVDGANKWDEEWELGGYNDSTGAKTNDNSKIRAKNYNSCLPSTTYYGIAYGETGGGIYINILFYDKDKNFISKTIIGGSTVTTPSNAYYFTFYMQNSYGTTYKNNICINVSNAEFNGTYVPYVSQTLPIDLTSIEDSGGNKLFADGKLRLGDYITPYSQLKGRKQVETNDGWNYGSNGAGTLYIISQKYTATTTTDIISTNKVVSQYAWWNMETPSEITVTFDSNSGGLVIIPPSDLQTVANIIPQCNIEALLRTPLTSNTDLSQLVKFEAYSNGSITLVNTNNQDTTSTFKYLKEVTK